MVPGLKNKSAVQSGVIPETFQLRAQANATNIMLRFSLTSDQGTLDLLTLISLLSEIMMKINIDFQSL